MRNINVILSMLFVLNFTWVFAQPSTVGGPHLFVESEIIEYGDIAKDSDGSRTFVVTNTGDAPLIISKCEKTCGCTVPKCDPTPILPGATSEIKVTYDTKRVGPFHKSIKVHSNDPENPMIMLRIKGKVIDTIPTSE